MTSKTFCRRSQRPGSRPTVPVKAVVQGCVANARLFRPLHQAHRFPVVCDHAVRAGIARLLFRGGPSAVAGLVISVVVGVSVERVLRGRLAAHVSKEVFKRQPPVAYLNSTLAVVLEVLATRTTTPREHRPPCPPFRRVLFAMYRACATSALRAASSREVAPVDGLLYPAPTAAKPNSLPPLVVRVKPNDVPQPKGQARQVFEVGMTIGRINSSHQKNLHNRFGRWIGPGGSYNLPPGPFHYATPGRGCQHAS